MSRQPQSLKAYLLCRYAEQSSLYNTWMDQLPCDAVVVDDAPASWRIPDDAGIVIAHDHFRWELITGFRKTLEQSRIPTLMLADGILEYRNTWQNPTIPDGSIYQPLIADKIACIGANSARMIESWGNAGKVEIVGLPRLDSFLQPQPRSTTPGQFRLLVGTATTPSFDDQQRATVIRSLQAVRSWAQQHGRLGEREVEVRWRLTDGLEQEIDVAAPPDDLSWQAELLLADAVITTPSTIFLESLLAKIPTAILDFSNSPTTTGTAWSVTAAAQIDSVIRELASPPAAKMLFQDFLLHDNLSCRSPAVDRMVQLVTAMIDIGQQCRWEHRDLVFPARILPDHATGVANPLPMSELFPDNPAFTHNEVAQLQAELSQAIFRLETMPQELTDKNNQITQLQSALDESRRRVADVRARLFKLRKILGIGKENQDSEAPLE